ncbi:flagellar assembly protein FliW [Stieleria varia]|uniref:Flagellar assembly factor FliW n=1 Tax=Stieleria varia TaxID=2528005 RepID=A0A5C5ZWV9_9BACT|nr:flagellar assembly protein FliW [Stieleria varia]TWT92112.1 Flagellar assembly factor FliW [Stieleria varia]
MRIDTQRFGTIHLEQDQLFLFPSGLVGMEMLRQWALLPDPSNPSVAWLQSAARGDRALAVVSPRAFYADYRVEVSRRDLACLHLSAEAELYVLSTLSGHSGRMTTNLRAPILLNLSRRLGCQIVTAESYPIQYALPTRRNDTAASDTRPTGVATKIAARRAA